MQNWKAQGLNIAWMTLLLDNVNDQQPPTESDALAWRDQFGLNSSYVAADPGFAMVPGSSVGTPQLTIINPRTMEVISLQEGFVDNALIEQTAMQNQ